MASFPKLPAPVATRRPLEIEQLGRLRTDDYAWMKDPNWQAVMRDPAALDRVVRQHLEAENAYTRGVLNDTEELQSNLYAEMRARIKEDDASPPHQDGAFLYWTQYRTGGQHPMVLRRRADAAAGEPELLLDGDALASGTAYFHLGAADHSPDHRLLAYAVDEQGSEYHTIHIKEIDSGAPVGAPIENAEGGLVFSAAGDHVFWVHRDANARASKVFRRPTAGGPEDERLVFEEQDEGMFVHLGETQSRRFIVISSGNHETSSCRVLEKTEPLSDFLIVEPRTEGLMYALDHWEDRFVIRTNADGAIDFKLVTAPIDNPGRAGWRDLTPHRPGRFLIGFVPFKDRLARLERSDANHRLIVMDRDGAEREIPFDEEAYALSLDPGYAYDTPELRYVYQSPTTPRTWIQENLATGERRILKVQEVPSGHDPRNYRARRLHAEAPDGALVPITLITRGDAEPDGTRPLFLYGYGSYGAAMDPIFSIRTLSLVDRGFNYAIAHVRGGSEKGWSWFLDGRGLKKKNTFTDFIAAARRLEEDGYARPGRTVACGGSAGGMLMGAIVNLAPERFAGVIAAVPFVDVLNTMSDPSLPLTPPEWPEWGNPLLDPEAYDYILSYSPYDNIAPRPHPAVLATGGLSDPRVTYWEPAKWVARLRAHQEGDAPILLKINMDAGHQGAAGRFESLKETALEWAFALRAAGLA